MLYAQPLSPEAEGFSAVRATGQTACLCVCVFVYLSPVNFQPKCESLKLASTRWCVKQPLTECQSLGPFQQGEPVAFCDKSFCRCKEDPLTTQFSLKLPTSLTHNTRMQIQKEPTNRSPKARFLRKHVLLRSSSETAGVHPQSAPPQESRKAPSPPEKKNTLRRALRPFSDFRVPPNVSPAFPPSPALPPVSPSCSATCMRRCASWRISSSQPGSASSRGKIPWAVRRDTSARRRSSSLTLAMGARPKGNLNSNVHIYIYIHREREAYVYIRVH